MSKYAVHQTDQNEKQLVEYLRARGAQVEKIHRPVDLLIAFRGRTAIAEVKTKAGKLNAAQGAFLTAWGGLSMVLRTEADCDQLLRDMEALTEL